MDPGIGNPVSFGGRVIIHVGPHKTATTTIQNFFTRNYGPLAELGCLYPRAGRAAGTKLVHYHHPLFLSVIEGRLADFDRQLFEIGREVEHRQPDIVLLSSEVLARQNLSDGVFDRIIAAFPNAQREWVYVVRRQD